MGIKYCKHLSSGRAWSLCPSSEIIYFCKKCFAVLSICAIGLDTWLLIHKRVLIEPFEVMFIVRPNCTKAVLSIGKFKL